MENCEEYNAERTIPTPSHLKSSVWKHFGFYTVGGKVTNKDKAVCRLCKRELSYLSTTSNLRTYLLAYHRNVAAEEQLPSGAAQSVQPRVTAFYSAHSAGPLPDPRNKAITGKIVYIGCVCHGRHALRISRSEQLLLMRKRQPHLCVGASSCCVYKCVIKDVFLSCAVMNSVGIYDFHKK